MAENDKANILIVDDSPGKLLAMSAALAELQGNVVTANSGREALRRLLQQEFAVILLDVHLADIDAREVLKHVKSNPDLQLTKVIAMSGKMTDEEAKGLTATGFDGLLRKPFHVRQVIEAIEDAMAVVY